MLRYINIHIIKLWVLFLSGKVLHTSICGLDGEDVRALLGRGHASVFYPVLVNTPFLEKWQIRGNVYQGSLTTKIRSHAEVKGNQNELKEKQTAGPGNLPLTRLACLSQTRSTR